MSCKVFRIIFASILTLVSVQSFSSGLSELLPDERNTVEIFQKFSPTVVYVHRLSTMIDKESSELMRVQSGAGSGFIWDKEGHIVTNFHVVKGAGELAVTIGNITSAAKVIGVDPRKDIAVLKVVSPKILPLLSRYVPFEMVKTKSLFVGQTAIAIGNPFGLDHSLTIGIISALGRQVPGAGGVTIRDMIQTDAPINPGNSGGPLLDSHGGLIGMNTAIYSKSGASAGIGFAVPSDDIMRIVPQLIKNGRVVLAGIGIHPVDPRVASSLGVKEGILIGAVLPKTPAAKIGLHQTIRNAWGHIVLGDIIIGLNGHQIDDYDALYYYLTEIKVGDGVTITVLRNGVKLSFKMKTIDIASY